MTKWPVQKQTYITAQRHAEHQYVTDVQNKLFLCVFVFNYRRVPRTYTVTVVTTSQTRPHVVTQYAARQVTYVCC